MASLSTCHLGLWLGWQILLNLVKYAFDRCVSRSFKNNANISGGKFSPCRTPILHGKKGNTCLVNVFIIHDLASLYKLNITVKMFPSILFDNNFNHRNVLFTG